MSKKRLFVDSFKDPEIKKLEEKLKTSTYRNDLSVNTQYAKRKEDLFKAKITELYVKSIEDVLGKDGVDNYHKGTLELSPEDRSAVIFHFTKFHLSKHILDTLQPRVYNMSCKDAIDRGGIHTLWYHMNEKFERHKREGTPAMSKDEFLMMLDYPALIVKYRTLNANKNLLWNVLNHRMEKDPEFAAAHTWASEWLLQNTPQKVKEIQTEPEKKMQNEPSRKPRFLQFSAPKKIQTSAKDLTATQKPDRKPPSPPK